MDDDDDQADLYRILGVSRAASTEEIKSAARKRALETHPDKQQQNHGQSANNALFQEIDEAKQVLTDPDKRRIYDAAGVKALKLVKVEGARHRSHADIISEIRLKCSEEALREVKDAANAASEGSVVLKVDATSSRRPQIVRWYVREGFDLYNTESLAIYEPPGEDPPYQLLQLEGRAWCERTYGAAMLFLTYTRHLTSQTQFVAKTSMGNQREGIGTAVAELQHQLSKDDTASVEVMLHTAKLNYAWTRQLGPGLSGSLVCTVAESGVEAVNASLSRRLNTIPMSLRGEITVQQGEATVQCSARYAWRGGSVSLQGEVSQGRFCSQSPYMDT